MDIEKDQEVVGGDMVPGINPVSISEVLVSTVREERMREEILD